MKNPFFSVIIPILNEEKYLPRLLENLTKQTYRHFEVIVMDARSQDSSVKKAALYQKKLPRLLILQSSKRNSRFQRNKAALKATGNYLVLLEADIQVYPAFLQKIYMSVRKNPKDCYTTLMETDSASSIDRAMILVANVGIIFAKGIGRPFAGGFNTIVKRRVYLNLKGYREDIVISDDHEFATRLVRKGYTFGILTNLKIIYSFRRYQTQGRFRVLSLYIWASLYFLVKGSLKQGQLSYQMGGHMYRDNTFRSVYAYNQPFYSPQNLWRTVDLVNRRISLWRRKYL